MPLSSNPQSKARFYLESDSDVPMKDRAVWFIKFLTEAEHQQHQALDERAMQATQADGYKIAAEMLSLGLVGWDNVKYPADHAKVGQAVPFDVNELLNAGVLTEQELWYLARLYPNAVRPVKADLKNSELPQAVAPAASAKSAKGGSA